MLGSMGSRSMGGFTGGGGGDEAWGRVAVSRLLWKTKSSGWGARERMEEPGALCVRDRGCWPVSAAGERMAGRMTKRKLEPSDRIGNSLKDWNPALMSGWPCR